MKFSVKDAFSGLDIFLKYFKIYKNAFYFILKGSFVLKILQFLS